MLLFVTGQAMAIGEAAVSLRSREHASTLFPADGSGRLLQGHPSVVFLGARAAGCRHGATVAEPLTRGQAGVAGVAGVARAVGDDRIYATPSDGIPDAGAERSALAGP